MRDERLQLARQVETLSSKLMKKEERLRGSMDALAKASYKLRASFTAEVRAGVGAGLGYGGGGESMLWWTICWCRCVRPVYILFFLGGAGECVTREHARHNMSGIAHQGRALKHLPRPMNLN